MAGPREGISTQRCEYTPSDERPQGLSLLAPQPAQPAGDAAALAGLAAAVGDRHQERHAQLLQQGRDQHAEEEAVQQQHLDAQALLAERCRRWPSGAAA
jgi:hypothetical protein